MKVFFPPPSSPFFPFCVDLFLSFFSLFFFCVLFVPTPELGEEGDGRGEGGRERWEGKGKGLKHTGDRLPTMRVVIFQLQLPCQSYRFCRAWSLCSRISDFAPWTTSCTASRSPLAAVSHASQLPSLYNNYAWHPLLLAQLPSKMQVSLG